MSLSQLSQVLIINCVSSSYDEKLFKSVPAPKLLAVTFYKQVKRQIIHYIYHALPDRTFYDFYVLDLSLATCGY